MSVKVQETKLTIIHYKTIFMLGIENLKKAGKFGVSLGMQFEEATADEKFTWTDLFGFFDELIQIPGIVNNRAAIVAEFKDLDETERNELLEYLKDEFNLDNDTLEAKIEKGLDIAFALLSYIEKPAAEEPPIMKTEGELPSTSTPGGSEGGGNNEGGGNG